MTEEVDIKFGGDASGANAAINQVAHALAEVFGGGIENAIEQLKELGEGLLAVFTIEKIAEFVKSIGELGEQTERTAAMLGISTEQVGKFNAIAELTGGSSERMTFALERLQLNLAKVKDTSSPAGAALDALGLSAKQLITLPIPEQMALISDKVAQFADGGQKTAIVMALLGRGGAQMIPVLDQGRQGFEELGAVAERAGTALDEMTTKGLAQSAHATTELGLSFTGLGVTIFGIFKPAIDGIVAGLTDMVQGFNDSLKSGGFVRDMLDLLSVALNVVIATLRIVSLGLKLFWDTAILVVDEVGIAFIGLGKLIKNTMTFHWAGTKEAFSSMIGDMKERAAAWSIDVIKDTEHTAAAINKIFAAATNNGEAEKKPNAPSMDMGKADSASAALKALDGQIKILELGLAEKKAILNAEVAQGQITEDMKFAQVEQYTEKAYQAEQALYQKELALDNLKPEQKQTVLNKIAELEQKHRTEMINLDAQSVAARTKIFEQYGNALESSFNGQLRGLLAGTTSFVQAGKAILGDMIIFALEQFVKMGMQWGVQQLAMTTATQTGALARATAEQAASASGNAINYANAAASILRSSVQTFAGVFANLSPVLGPAASGPAAASQAAVAASVGELVPALDVGAWNIDRTTFAQLHPDELVAPAPVAPFVRDFLSGNNKGSGGDSYSLQISALDGQSVKRLFMQQGGALLSSLKKQLRQGATA